MRRAPLPAALAVLLCLAVAVAASPAWAGAADADGLPAAPAGKAAYGKAKAKRCKKKAKRGADAAGKRKGCRRKKGQAPGGAGGGAGGPTGPPGRLLVTEVEYSLQLSRPSVAAGQVIVEQYNHGEDPHDLRVQKESDPSSLFSYDTLDPGLTAKQTLTLTPGTWKLYCSLLDHQSLGMLATLTVN